MCSTITKSNSGVLEDIDENEDETELESETEPSVVLNDVTKDEVLGGVRGGEAESTLIPGPVSTNSIVWQFSYNQSLVTI